MTWMDSNYSNRAAIAVDNNAGGGTNIDATVTIPQYWDSFWSSIQANGHDVRFTQSDGTTGLAYNRDTWDYAAKSGIFKIDSIVSVNNQTTVIYMYWGNAAAADGSSSPSISSAKTGEIEVGAPSAPVIVLKLDEFGSTLANQRFQKTAAEAIDVWVDCRRMLAKRREATEYSMRYEELHSIDLSVEANGSNQSSMIDETKTRALSEGWAKVRVKAGSSGTSYTVIVKITTSLTRIIEARAVMKVQDTDES